MRTPRLLPLAAVVALAAAAPASAHEVDVDTIASGLDNPRHVAVSEWGSVYVAEAGKGASNPATATSCFNSAEGPACTGATGAITKIDRHGQRRVVRGLASFAVAELNPEMPDVDIGDNAIGPHGVYVKGHRLFFTNGGPTAPFRGVRPYEEYIPRDPTLVDEDPVSARYGKLFELRHSGGLREIADLWAFENENNPDAEDGNPLVDSNPVDVLVDRGRFIVADAGGNTLLRARRGGDVEVLSLFPNILQPNPFEPGDVPMNAVPTGVVKGPDGAYYMSQLTGFPFPVGGAKVFRVDPRTGAYTTYAEGFTNAMDLDFGHDGTLYVLEIDNNSLLVPGAEGAIWVVPPGGGTPQRLELPAGTLTAPGGIAVGSRGTLYVSNRATDVGEGEVLRIRLGHRPHHHK